MSEHPGIAAIRRLLKEMRRDEQGGYSGYGGDGRWHFVSTSIGQFTPEELNDLFDLVGIVPDKIVSLGSCSTCIHAKELKDGRLVEQGYQGPCLTCKRPKMHNWRPRFITRAQRVQNRDMDEDAA
jgi:hypothetical protein